MCFINKQKGVIMQVNNNSYSTVSNIQFGSSDMPVVWVFSQTFTLPSITLSPPKVNSRSGAMVNLASDTVEYDNLNIDVILDKKWKVWNDLYLYFIDGLNVTTGAFLKEKIFDLWIEFFDGSGKSVKKFMFYKCRLQSFGDINLSTMDSEDELNTLTLSFVFDYMEDMELTFYKQELINA